MMKVTISNNIIIEDPNTEVYMWAVDNLTVRNPVYQQLKIAGKEDTIRRKRVPEFLALYSMVYNLLIIPFGTLRTVWPMIKDCDVKLKFNSAANISVRNDKPVFNLYDYQEKAVDFMIKQKGGVLQAPCGSGKTIMGIEMIRRIGKRALWLCHTGDLLRQAKSDMLELYPNMKIGMTTEGKLEIGEDVTISTIQTLEKIDPQLYINQFDVVICDECSHVAGAPTQMKMFQKVISQIPARYKYGLTATPARSDKMTKAMYAYIGCNKDGDFEPTYKISKNDVNTIPSTHKRIDMYSGYDGRKILEIVDTSGMMEYSRLITSLSENKERTMKIIDQVVECNKEGRKQVVLSLRVDHCKEIAKELENRGVKVELVTGKTTSDKKREAVLKQKVDWDVIVSTYSLLKEGVSIKELDTLHLATPIKDKGMIVQCAGRIERYLPNKKEPIVYDYVDIDIPYCEKRYVDRRRALKNRFY